MTEMKQLEAWLNGSLLTHEGETDESRRQDRSATCDHSCVLIHYVRFQPSVDAVQCKEKESDLVVISGSWQNGCVTSKDCMLNERETDSGTGTLSG